MNDSNPEHISSWTYKLKPPEDVSEHAAYFTIVGDKRPIAFFFNSKDMKSFQWIISKMTDMSRMLEYNIPIEVIIKDMKTTFQPQGDYFIPGTDIHVHSVIHHLGLILEEHVGRLKEK